MKLAIAYLETRAKMFEASAKNKLAAGNQIQAAQDDQLAKNLRIIIALLKSVFPK